jgi:hypothetical protein
MAFIDPPYQVPFPQPTAQTSYLVDFPNPGYGTVADIADAQDFVSGVNVTDAYTPFGIFIVRDQPSGDDAYKAPAGNITVPGGFVSKTLAIESTRNNLPPNYPKGDRFNLMKEGRMWLNPETPVVAGNAVYVRVTPNGPYAQTGAVRADADGGNAILLAGAKFVDTTTANGQPARVEFDLIGK